MPSERAVVVGAILSRWESKNEVLHVRAARFVSGAGVKAECLAVECFTKGGDTVFSVVLRDDQLPTLMQGVERWHGYLDDVSQLTECFK